MKSDDIYLAIQKRMVELSKKAYMQIIGLIIPIEPFTEEETIKFFKPALFDYTINKLSITEENRVLVEDLSLIFKKLEPQFSSTREKQLFYKNYVFCLLNHYSQVIRKSLVWEVVSKEEKENSTFPRIVGNNFQTKEQTSYEEATLWLFTEYEREIEKQKDAGSKKTYQKKKRNNFF